MRKRDEVMVVELKWRMDPRHGFRRIGSSARDFFANVGCATPLAAGTDAPRHGIAVTWQFGEIPCLIRNSQPDFLPVCAV